jgi:hypothetical protein
MDTNSLNVGLILVSLCCAGGLYAYVRDARRLQRLISTGAAARATVLKKEKIAGRSESVVLCLVTYEFSDERGNTVVHEQGLNRSPFFDTLAVGDQVEVVYERGGTGNSYPLSQVRADRNIAGMISEGIVLLWGAMGAILT